MILPLFLLSIVAASLGATTRPPAKYPTTTTFTSKATLQIPPPGPFALPVFTYTFIEQDITILEPHPSLPTTYPETITQTAITKATSTIYSFTPFSTGSTIFTVTDTTTRFDTYLIHTPAPSHLRPGYSFTDFPGCGDCVLDADWTPAPKCETKSWGTGCANQQCQWRENEGEAGLWYCFAGPQRGDREHMGRLCWYGTDDFWTEMLAEPCLYGDQLPHCVPCVGAHVKCGEGEGECMTRPGHPEFRAERPERVTSRKGWM